MSLQSVPPRTPVLALLLGLFAFALLAVRFSPNWPAFRAGIQDAYADAIVPAQRAAVESAILSGHSERGLHVIRQARDLGTTIEDPNHKIVRFRLLMPAIGHVFRLPDWLTLGLAHIGCLAWILAVVAIGRAPPGPAAPRPHDAVCLALVAGASAPFFASMGWLGYYDSWLVLALLAAAFARPRWIVWLACLLGPWVDERFVLGLPLALLVRWLWFEGSSRPVLAWLKEQAALPLLFATVYAVVRLQLGGSSGSQTVGEYFHQFIFSQQVSAADRLFGAWSGLRVGWVLVIAAIVIVGLAAAPRPRLRAGLLAGAVIGTSLIGLYTALDLSRSMALLTPVVILGWILAGRTTAWNRFHLTPLLAVAALALPARHAVGRHSIRVDNALSASLPLLTAQNNIGLLYSAGDNLPKDNAKAARWYRKAAEVGHAEAQNNLGAMYQYGDGVAQDFAAALRWYHLAADQGNVIAQYNLGVMYAQGSGVPRDLAEAARWYRMAADRGFANAQNNLGALYVDGAGVPKSEAEAINWYRKAAVQGIGAAQMNLGALYAQGSTTPADPVQSYHWFLLALAMGNEGARDSLVSLEKKMTPQQVAEARRLVGETIQRSPKLKQAQERAKAIGR